MKRKFVLKTIIALIFVVIFDGLFFLIKDLEDCPASVWASFIGLNVAYLSLFLVPLLAPKGKGETVLSDTLYLVGSMYGTIYIIVQFFVGCIFIFWEPDSVVLPVSIHLILLGIYVAILLSNVLANDATRRSLKEQNAQSDKLKTMLEVAYASLQLVKGDGNAYKCLSRLCDELKASPIGSSPEVLDIEGQISSSLMLMRDYASAGNLSETLRIANYVLELTKMRNFKLKNQRHY